MQRINSLQSQQWDHRKGNFKAPTLARELIVKIIGALEHMKNLQALYILTLLANTGTLRVQLFSLLSVLT